ncbi:hypothetical protein [Acholeplasma palmae]|nr:hypothetical protein [Alteracholeplasma palmae]
MNKEKKLIIGTVGYILVMVAIAIIRDNAADHMKTALLLVTRIMVIALIVFFILAAYMIAHIIKKNNKEFQQKVIDKKYDELLVITKAKSEKYYFGRLIINSKFNLLVILFILGKNDEAFELLNHTYWRTYSNGVVFYRVLELLYKDKIDEAKKIREKLRRIKHQENNLAIIDHIISFKQDNQENEKLTKSIYPIVREMCSNNKTTHKLNEL